MKRGTSDATLLTFGGHLEVLRRMFFRMIAMIVSWGVVIFCCKEWTFHLLLAPREWDFVTYRWIEKWVNVLGMDFHFEPFRVELISTGLSSQFMTHLSASFYLALLAASPYILCELFRFISPALYEQEKRYSVYIAAAMYVLFIIGVLMSYFVIFPISFRFLGTYQVDESVRNMITLSSYISTFSTLTFIMGLVFQLPVVAFVLAKLSLITSSFMAHYRKHAFVVLMTVSALITPPDLFTLALVTVPLYLLYELCIVIVRHVPGGTAIRERI